MIKSACITQKDNTHLKTQIKTFAGDIKYLVFSSHPF